MDNEVESFDLENDFPDLVNLNDLKEITNEVGELHQTPKVLECNNCNEKFSDVMLLKIHKMFHSKTNYCFLCKSTLSKDFHGHITRRHLNIVCSICDKVFTWKKSLKTHMTSHSGETAFKCSQCDKSFKQSGSLKTHILSTHEGIKPFVCGVCQSTFTTSSSLKKHLKRMHATDEAFECRICCESFLDRKQKFDHERTHKTSLKKCDICGEGFITTYATTKHLMTQHYNTEKCQYCEKMYHKSLLAQHILLTHQPKSCDICSLIFYNSRSFARHQIIHRKVEICKLCGKNLRGINMEKHMDLHRKNKAQKCKICNVLVSNIDTHNERVHKNTKFLFCTACPKKFDTKKQKIRHYIEKHKNILKCCSFCRKKFVSSVKLDRHVALVHNTSSYKCKECGKLLHSFETLQRHESKHISSDTLIPLPRHTFKFKCTTCGKPFKYSDALQRHKCYLGTFHCNICDIKYTNRRYVRRHMILFHSPRILSDDKDETDIPAESVQILKGDKQRYQCKRCLMVLTSRISFKKHFCHSQNNGPRSYLNYKGIEWTQNNKCGKKLTCELCGFMSFNKRCMRNHQIRLHIMENNDSKKSTCRNRASELQEQNTSESIKQEIKMEPEESEANFKKLDGEIKKDCGLAKTQADLKMENIFVKTEVSE